MNKNILYETLVKYDKPRFDTKLIIKNGQIILKKKKGFIKKEYKVVDTININDIKVTKGKLLVSSNNLEVKIDTKSRVYRFKCKNINEANNIIEQIKEYKLSESIFKKSCDKVIKTVQIIGKIATTIGIITVQISDAVGVLKQK